MNETFHVDFIGIGAEKSGTTWIADCLREHPEVCLSKRKELHFFNEVEAHYLKVKNLNYAKGFEWYKQQFDHCGPEKIVGEFTSIYLYCPKAAERIKKCFPDVKIIVTLREPVSRSFSQYLNDKRLGVIPNMTFERAIAEYENYIEKGYYYKHLSVYYSLFSREHILVVLFDDIENRPGETIKMVYNFLNLRDVEYSPKMMDQRSNVARRAVIPFLNYAIFRTRHFLRKNQYLSLLKAVSATGIKGVAYYIRDKNTKEIEDYPKIDPSTTGYLKGLYADDIKRLEELIHRNLDSWKL